MMNKNVTKRFQYITKQMNYSGALLVREGRQPSIKLSSGYRNRSEELPNEVNTRFGIASGCKLFTAIAICQLIQLGKLSFHDDIQDYLDIELPWTNGITVHHLLTHTSGVPDYFDEEVMGDFEELWEENPMYQFRQLCDFIPLFQQQPMKMQPGERFHYNNTGYILLGLIVEKVTGTSFTQYIEEHIFKKAHMYHSGYFSFDSLPSQTALGYIDEPDGTWRTNMYSLPIRGGADGGAFITVDDMERLWDALMNYELLNADYTKKLLTPHVHENENSFYGYGIWIEKSRESIRKYHLMGYDPGVNFHSAYYPDNAITFVACSNTSNGSFHLMKELENNLRLKQLH
ncbi:Penicillin-binding protein E [Virgibacillus salexigens]|uniref:Penicillin-binding protein E n=2 Tax=Bacillaceae TaxID=186817 RepID=A0A024QG87_9BACI|nr:Penicillin-binding protein E [Virgibacillus massiliensis]